MSFQTVAPYLFEAFKFLFILLIWILGDIKIGLAITNQDLKKLRLPPGFSIEIFANDVPGARSLAIAEDHVLFVGAKDQGSVYALEFDPATAKVKQKYTIGRGLNMPNGVAFLKGDLFVGEVHRIQKYSGILSQLKSPPEPKQVGPNFPTDTHHGWKFIAFGPDNKLYVPVGAPCNICEKSDPRYASLTRMNADGSDFEIIAHGIRNTVGFDWQPGTKELWFTDNGRDWLGDDKPPCELNRMSKINLHFGFPYCHGKNTLDPEFGKEKKCADYQAPAQELGPHVAPLGMRFYTGSMFPAEYKNQIFIAEHGSWNRSKPIGYRVMTVKLDGSKAKSYEPFIEGWLQGDQPWGRPVDVLKLNDGSLLVSDDTAGAIYRVVYNAPVRPKVTTKKS